MIEVHIFSFLHFLRLNAETTPRTIKRTKRLQDVHLIQSLCTTCCIFMNDQSHFTKPNYYAFYLLFIQMNKLFSVLLLFWCWSSLHSWIFFVCFEWIKVTNSWTSFNWWIWLWCIPIKWISYIISWANLYDSIVRVFERRLRLVKMR